MPDKFHYLLSGNCEYFLKSISYFGLFFKMFSTFSSKFLSHFLYNSKAFNESLTYATVLAPKMAVDTFLL